MKVPPPQMAPEKTVKRDTIKLQVARALLFGIGGVDGNASLAVLADSLDEELSIRRRTTTE